MFSIGHFLMLIILKFEVFKNSLLGLNFKSIERLFFSILLLNLLTDHCGLDLIYVGSVDRSLQTENFKILFTSPVERTFQT